MSTRGQDSGASRPPRPASSCTDTPSRHGGQSTSNSAFEADVKSKELGGSSAMEELLRPLIVVKPHPPKLTVKPRSLQPLMLLPREHLRLSFLDLSAPYGSFESSVFFEANIRILDLESRMGSRPVVLIARLESNKSVYAIERQANALYILCHLGSWVDLEQLCDLATISCSALVRDKPALPAELTARAPLITPQISHTNKKRRIAIEAIQSLVKKPIRSPSISALSQIGEASRPPTPTQGGNAFDGGSVSVDQDAPSRSEVTPKSSLASQADVVQEQDEALHIPTADGIFENIRNHYFEALYHSMGSLAYFAKGPLSRARAAFHLDCDSTLEMSDLVEFLKSLVMTTAQIDKKYHEAIPRIQLEMKTAMEDSDVEQGQSKPRTRKRKARKMKIGKDGLYPNEDEHVRKWWVIHKPITKDDEESSTTRSTEQQDIKLQVSLLRSRETQLQMIIILEVLSLEPMVAREAANESQLPGMPPAEEPLDLDKETPPKKRNKHNLPLLLDVHADRLCIWQSTTLDELSINESQNGSRPDSRKSSKSTSDPLKDFCVDIIVPFFSARLPEHCDSINRKLGGPVMMPPQSARKKTETMPKATSKPGAAANRPIRSKATRNLEAFLSQETERNRRSISRGPSGVIALMRSASTPTIPLLKREASEPLSLASIPKAEAGISQGKHILSLDPLSAKRRAESKEKRAAFVKAELQDAISTLRRPNRDIVGKAMAEADERRAVTSLSQLRKSRKPTQFNRFQSVVKATPVASRFRDALAKERDSQSSLSQRFDAVAEEQAPPSSMVPSSAPRKRDREAAFGSEPAIHPTLDTLVTEQVIATPPKTSALNRNFLSAPQPDSGVVLASSPVMARKLNQPSFVTKARPATLGHRDGGVVLAETPVKSRNVIVSMDDYITVTPVKRRMLDNGASVTLSGTETNDTGNNAENRPGRKITIFERLGWDDDYDLA
ncbi:DNA replication regulator SLD3-domain-containing protein [Xylaria sp. FL0064]|nr:DNA replication regulator SLD3-domain-containing protein [Xylaria sp. FL0064]